MTPEELDRKFGRLWERVASPSGGEAAPPLAGVEPFTASPVGDAALETLGLVQRRQRAARAEWQGILAAKEAALAELSRRLREAQGESLELRRRLGLAERDLLQGTADVAAKLEAARAALAEAEERSASREGSLRETLEKARKELAAEKARALEAERRGGLREEELLGELSEMRSRLEAAGRLDEKSRKLAEELKEAKSAVEATLGELVSERRLREAAEGEREKSGRRTQELAERLHRLQAAWEEERKQWAELWDRERSTWETQRQEFASWEERLRKEREAWQQEIQQKQGEVMRFETQLTRTLRDSSETASKLSKVLEAVSGPRSGVVVRYVAMRRRRLLVAGALVLAAVCAYPVWRKLSETRLELLSSRLVSLDNPTAVAYDGSSLWIAEWSGGLLTLDPADPSGPAARREIPAGAYRPVSLAFGGGALWSLDAAQGRILKHSPADPSRIESAWPAPGPAPTALAHDGANLWSYDAVTRTLYRHLGEGPKGGMDAFPFEFDAVPAALAWIDGELWVLDGKGKRLLRLRPEAGALRLVEALPFDAGALSLAGALDAEGRSRRRLLWSLAGGAKPGFAIRKHRIR